LTLVALVTSMMGCHTAAPPVRPTGASGRWHVVESGETLEALARLTGVPEEDLLEVNGMHSSAEVVPGKAIFLLEPSRPPATAAPAGTAPIMEGPLPAAALANKGARFRWPVDAPRVTSFFGARWGRAHEGIDLTAPIGTPVYAADAGEVVYAGSVLRGYGRMVVLKHDRDLMTVYAHNSVLLVKVGDHVTVGQRVALSGQSGRATGPHVHFEVRRGQVPRNPLPYLPSLRPVRERSPKS
jgi:murein DD-endopeptidase MepM/ murein hydrolase activator NlpD